MIENIFSQQIVLENERVLMRPIELSDFDNLLPFALNEPDVWKYSLVNAAGEKAMRDYITAAIANRDVAQKEYAFIVFDKKANAYAGSTRFYDIQPFHKTALLGYTWYGKAFQRTGLNRHCKFLLLQFAFEQWGLERVEFRADTNNARSITAMKAIGCKPEGLLRSHMSLGGDLRRDTIILSILKDDWINGGKQLLQSRIKY